MKKTISLVLCALMLFACIPLSASAASTVTFSESGSFASSSQLESNVTYIIPDGVTMTVPSGLTLYLPTGAILRVNQGGKLVVNGSIISMIGSQLFVDGTLTGAAGLSGEGDLQAAVRFPDLATEGLSTHISVAYSYSISSSPYADLTENIVYNAVSNGGATVYVPFNSYVYLKASINEPDAQYDKFDDSLFDVYYNGISTPYGQGSHYVKVTTAGDITYSRWTNDNDYLNTFTVYLPNGTGYNVYGRSGETESVKLKYGQAFSFRVEIDPAYDMSSYEVYVYNGYGWTGLDTSTLLSGIEPCVPDEYGYYTIDSIKGNHTIYVVGVIKNETINLVGNILDMIKNVMNMIKAFFEQFMALFQ